MIKVFILLLFLIYFAKTKIIHFDTPYYEFDSDNDLEPEFMSSFEKRLHQGSDESGKLWVLKIENDLNATHLRKGSIQEESVFDNIIDPMRDTLEKRLRRKVANVQIDEILPNWNSLQKETIKSINRFIMSIQSSPEAYLSEYIADEEMASLTFYIKEYFTTLLVSHGRHEWRYVLGPPSPLPHWFFEEHLNILRDGQDIYVEIPREVKFQLFQGLIHMLKKFSSYLI